MGTHLATRFYLYPACRFRDRYARCDSSIVRLLDPVAGGLSSALVASTAKAVQGLSSGITTKHIGLMTQPKRGGNPPWNQERHVCDITLTIVVKGILRPRVELYEYLVGKEARASEALLRLTDWLQS